MMYVRDHMAADPQVVHAGTLMNEAEETLKDCGFHQLPVVNDEGEVVGIVTDRDIRSAKGMSVAPHAGLLVEAVMTHDPFTVAEDTPLKEAIALLYEHRFGALPVIRDKVLVGIITRHDLIGALRLLLGLDRCGSGLEVAIPNGVSDVIRALQATDERDEILSVVAAPMQGDCQKPVLCIRTAAQDCSGLEQRLLAKGAVVLKGSQKGEAADTALA